jgi:hypothetical protein
MIRLRLKPRSEGLHLLNPELGCKLRGGSRPRHRLNPGQAQGFRSNWMDLAIEGAVVFEGTERGASLRSPNSSTLC